MSDLSLRPPAAAVSLLAKQRLPKSDASNVLFTKQMFCFPILDYDNNIRMFY